jgi:HPt (histidine-containing phosphotransfer) domain-containing protein
VPRGSGRWLTALFESGWTRFHQERFGRALGDLHTLAAPFFEEHFFPEAHILQAVVYWRHCRWQRSREALEAFNRRYPPLKREIDRLLARQRDPEELFEHARRQLAGAAGATEVDRLVAQALGDRDLARYFDQVRVVERELARVKAADAAWRATELGGAVLQDMAVQLALCRSEAGRQTRRRLGRIAKEIQSLTQQAIKVEYETILAQKDQLRGELRGYLVPPDRAGSPEVDDEHELWPFEGPYWRDELGAYHVRVGSQCPARRGGSAGLWHPLASRAVRDTPLEVSF